MVSGLSPEATRLSAASPARPPGLSPSARRARSWPRCAPRRGSHQERAAREVALGPLGDDDLIAFGRLPGALGVRVRTFCSTVRSMLDGSTPGRSKCTRTRSPWRYASIGITAGALGQPCWAGGQVHGRDRTSSTCLPPPRNRRCLSGWLAHRARLNPAGAPVQTMAGILPRGRPRQRQTVLLGGRQLT